MGSKDLRAQIKHVTLFAKAAVTATQSIQYADTNGFRGAQFIVDVGAWTADDLKVTFQDSDDHSTWANIADANLEGYANNIMLKHGHATSYLKVGYTGNKRYIGAIITDTGSGSVVVGIYVNLGSPDQSPIYT